jgi:hypothetical protein
VHLIEPPGASTQFNTLANVAILYMKVFGFSGLWLWGEEILSLSEI